MIFNPLFIGENGITQSLIPKSGKLANNKYLFSDIVKVVMNPSTKGNGKSSLNLNGINGDLQLGLESEQKLIQLKYRLLTDEHSEQVKSELADILPTEIAQLLINEELVASNDKAVSYISKEPLKGELQNFLHNLIGAEIIEQNISQKSGLLLNLEDQKSAVNIELVKDGNGKSVSDKIIVQTLVVPEKSRLLSIFGNENNNEAFFRTSRESADKLFASSSEIKLTNGQAEIIKPTLSVYSFSHDGNEFESLTKNIRSNKTFIHNLNFLKNSSDKVDLTTSKVPLEKISFVPSELKNNEVKVDGFKTEVSASKSYTNLKLVNTNEGKKESDYSVSKITIVKKQDENNVLNSVKSKSELTPKEFESALRRIDFNQKIGSQKSEIHLIKNTKSSSSLNDKITESSNIKLSEKSNNNVENKESKPKSVDNKNFKTDLNVKTGKKVISESPSTEFKNDKAENAKSNENKAKEKSESVKINAKEVSSEKLNVELKTVKTENNSQQNKVDDIKALNNTKAKINESIRPASSVNSKIASVEKSEPKHISDLKTEMKNNVTGQGKNATDDQVKKVRENDNSTLVQKENQEVKAATQNSVNPNIENSVVKDNKKFSVKIKGGIKSVSDKNESIDNSIEEKPAEGNTAKNSDANSDNNESKFNKSSSSSSGQFEMKQHVETNFQTLNKSEIGQLNFADNKTTFSEPKAAPQIIKSVEVIKEISEFISRQEKGSLSFDIRPEHLGRMKITLDTVDKMLKAHIEVDNEQAKQLVEKNIDKLQQQLSNNGLQLNSLNISLSYSKQQRDGKKINNKSQNESENLGQVGETEEEKSKKQLGYNTYEYIA